ncbi:hypothetical protein CRG98_022762 [Punica granatum]|uniref:Uncharacterized protein n=1 Tax=Punica granatum TaxID=22663 RepID=A0A2I0JKL3_PUNGR|nr:hypothetical protein CRG98_022762 [Punica granatum]
MPTLYSASLPKAQYGIVGMNHTIHLDLPSSALKISDALFKSLEIQSRQTEITVIFGASKQLRKQYEKSSFGLLGRLQLHICITSLRVNCSRCLTIYVKMTNVGCRYKEARDDPMVASECGCKATVLRIRLTVGTATRLVAWECEKRGWFTCKVRASWKVHVAEVAGCSRKTVASMLSDSLNCHRLRLRRGYLIVGHLPRQIGGDDGGRVGPILWSEVRRCLCLLLQVGGLCSVCGAVTSGLCSGKIRLASRIIGWMNLNPSQFWISDEPDSSKCDVSKLRSSKCRAGAHKQGQNPNAVNVGPELDIGPEPKSGAEALCSKCGPEPDAGPKPNAVKCGAGARCRAEAQCSKCGAEARCEAEAQCSKRRAKTRCGAEAQFSKCRAEARCGA